MYDEVVLKVCFGVACCVYVSLFVCVCVSIIVGKSSFFF